MRESRECERFILNAPTKLFLQKDHNDSAVIQSIAYDISSTGAFIKLKENSLKTHTDVDIEILLTIQKIQELYGLSNVVKLSAKASVIRSTNNGIGISFKGKRIIISTE